MCVIGKYIYTICGISLFGILLSCDTIFFTPDFNTNDEKKPEITVKGPTDTIISVGDPYTVIFEVSDDEDDSLDLIENTTIWVEDEWGDEADLDSFAKKAGTYTIFLFTTDSDGNKSDTVEITVCVSEEDVTAPVITLIGPDTFIVNLDDIYKEPGAIAFDNFDGNLTDRIVICGEVNTSEEEDYTLTYTVRDKAGNRTYKDRVVTVKKVSSDDKEKPEIRLKGANPMLVRLNEDFRDPGATAHDNEDGDITEKINSYSTVITSCEGTYAVFYTVADKAGNIASEKRTVTVEDFIDTVPPVITLLGDNPMCLDLLEKYNEPGAIAEDNIDGDLTDKIEINDDEVDIHQTGIYNVIYTVEDAAGNKTVEKRFISVGVIDTTPPEIQIIGDNPLFVDYKGPFNDPGAYAIDDVDDSIPFSKFEVEMDIDLNVLGDDYSITYIVKDNAGNGDTALRKVIVGDTISPKVTIIGPNPINLGLGFPYKEMGATAVDNYDGDITDKIDTLGEVNTSESGTYEITYRVEDSNGNIGEAVRIVNVMQDFEAPKIYLRGHNPHYIKINENFEDPGAFAVDNIDDTIPFSEFAVTGSVDESKIGTYILTYSVSDNAGNEAMTKRTVEVAQTIQVTDTFTLSRRKLDKRSNSGSTGGKVGAGERGSSSSDVFETLMYNSLSSLHEDAAILSVTVRLNISHVDYNSRDKTATLYEQDKGQYSSSARYNSYPDTYWTASLGTVRAKYNGWKEIASSSLKTLVQDWVDGDKDNEGLILGGSFGNYESYWEIDDAVLIVKWER